MFSLICVWINGSVNNREAGDLRRHGGHYDVNVMWWTETRLKIGYPQMKWLPDIQMSDSDLINQTSVSD